MHNPPDERNAFWKHHLETYGKVIASIVVALTDSDHPVHQDFIYEDFIPQFTASKFNASAWVELFDNAGAKV